MHCSSWFDGKLQENATSSDDKFAIKFTIDLAQTSLICMKSFDGKELYKSSDVFVYNTQAVSSKSLPDYV